MTRRKMMRAAGLGTILSGRLAANAAATRAKAFAVIGDAAHNSDYIRSALGSTLVQDAGLPIDFSDEEKLLTLYNLQNYRILIMFSSGIRHPNGYTHAMFWQPKPEEIVSVPPLQKKVGGPGVGWMTAEQGRAVKSWVQEGGSFWAFHDSSGPSLFNKDYRDVAGAVFAGHPPIRPYKVKIANHNHPITKGVNDFVVTDEQHFVVYDKDPKYVLARSINENGLTFKDNTGKVGNTCESVWAYEYGKGRVCFMAPGHTITALWNPEYEKMQKNAVKWLLRQT